MEVILNIDVIVVITSGEITDNGMRLLSFSRRDR